jgi:hypothetical protein
LWSIFLEKKIAYSLVCNVWKVYTRPISASDFFDLKLSNLHRENTIRVGDEIINVMGKGLRGLTMVEVQELLNTNVKTTGSEKNEIDLVICRTTSNSHFSRGEVKPRNASLDGHLDAEDENFTSFAIK